MKIHGLYLFAFILLSLCSGAQTVNYSILHYTTDNGLPQNSIKTINFDKAGYCWLGTEMGLVRFDGIHFLAFNSDNIKGELKSDRIVAIAKDHSGNAYAELEPGQQLAISQPQSSAAPLPKMQMQKMCFSRLNNLAIKPAEMTEVLNNYIFGLQYGGMNNFCIATSNTNVYVVVKGKLYYVRDTSLKLTTSIPHPYDKRLAVVNGRLILLQAGGQARIIKDDVVQSDALTITGPLNRSKAFRSGDYWLMRSATGAFVYAGKIIYRLHLENTRLVSEIFLKDTDVSGIDLSDVYTVYDNSVQQKYYLGTISSGLYIVTPSVFQYPQVSDKVIKNGFRSQAGIDDGERIVCEQYLYNRKGTVEMLPVARNIGATVYIKKDGVMYYGESPELYKFDLKTRQGKMLFKLDSRPSGILPDQVDSNFAWVSTSLSIGKLFYDTSIIFKKVPGRKIGSAIWGFDLIGRDSLLLTTQKGLKWYDWKHNMIYRSLLDSFSIHSVYVETADRIWISTNGKGNFLYLKGKVHALPESRIDALKTVHSFVDDGRHNFWLPTNNGLYRVSKDALLAYIEGKVKDVYYYSFSTQNDLRSNEFNGGSIPHYVWFKDSMLSLLSIKGPVWFYPNKIKIHYPDKQIYVDALEIDNTIMPYPDNGHTSLSPDFNNITLTVSSPYFGNKENLQLKYKVEGIDNDWQSVDDNGKIKLNRIPSGDYRLIVRKLDGRDMNHYNSLAFSFTVKPRFYNTWWFFAVLTVIIACGIYLSIKIRTRMLVRRNQKLSDIITGQTEDLRKTVQQLSVSEQELNESNRMKDNIITMVLHDLRSPIRFMTLISNYLASTHGKLSADELERKLKELKTSTISLNNFTEQFFTWAISHHKNFKVSKSWFTIKDVFMETEELYREIVETNGNQLVVEQANYSCFNDAQILTVIIRNLLDNANKHTQEGLITLSAKQEENELIITISDTGIGFSEKALGMFLNKKEYDGSKNGNGSFIVLSLIQLIGGKLEAISTPGTGTDFRIKLDNPQ
ncbi:MAG: ATP-binding protein [Taibaiella sp.]|jgi:signal transduction histidine kinase